MSVPAFTAALPGAMKRLTLFAACAASLLSHGLVFGQSAPADTLKLLEGRAGIELPKGDRVDVPSDSLLHNVRITSGTLNYYFRSFAVSASEPAEQFLNRTAESRMRAAASDVTVNLDRIKCGQFAGVELSFWMWHPTAKPQGLLLSKDRMLVVEDLFVSLSVEGDASGLIEGVADEFLDAITYLDERICTN